MLDANFDSQIQAALADYQALGRQAIGNAIHRATRKTARWGLSRVSRLTRQRVKLPARWLKKRIRMYAKSQGKTASFIKIWAGANAVNVGFLAKPRQTKKGVSAGGKTYAGTFIVKKFQNKVFQRKGAARFPIVGVTQALEPAMALAVRAVFRGMQGRFYEVLRQELRYELHKLHAKIR